MTIKVTNIQQSFLYLPSCEIINPIAAGETFWQDLAQGQLPALAKGRLFSTCSFA